MPLRWWCCQWRHWRVYGGGFWPCGGGGRARARARFMCQRFPGTLFSVAGVHRANPSHHLKRRCAARACWLEVFRARAVSARPNRVVYGLGFRRASSTIRAIGSPIASASDQAPCLTLTHCVAHNSASHQGRQARWSGVCSSRHGSSRNDRRQALYRPKALYRPTPGRNAQSTEGHRHQGSPRPDNDPL